MLRAEQRKVRTTRTTAGLLIAAVVVVVMGDVSTVMSADVDQLTGHIRDQPFHLVSSVNISLFALLVGIRSTTDEYRYETMVWTILSRRRRGWALAAKAAVAGLYGILLSGAAQAVGIAAALAIIRDRGASLTVDRADVAAIGGLVLAGGLWAVLGVLAGAVIRSQVAAVAMALVWVFAIENLGGLVLGDAARLLPGQAAHALGAVGGMDLLAPLAGLAVLVVYGMVLGAAALWQLDRRPIPLSP